MFYTVYKITNNINGKYYIGKHQTKDLNDGYMGSGKLIKQSIDKYGVENFTKQILFSFDNEAEMNAKEAELVTLSEETYNLCPGGKGGFGYINNAEIVKFKGKKHTEESKKKMGHPGNSYGSNVSETKRKELGRLGGLNNKGKPKSEEHKQKIREAILRKNAGLV